MKTPSKIWIMTSNFGIDLKITHCILGFQLPCYYMNQSVLAFLWVDLFIFPPTKC